MECYEDEDAEEDEELKELNAVRKIINFKSRSPPRN